MPTPRERAGDRAWKLVTVLMVDCDALATFGVSQDAASRVTAAVYAALSGAQPATCERLWSGATRAVTMPPQTNSLGN